MISSRRLAREWALKILYQTEHVTPGAQPVFDRLLGEVTRAEQRSRQRLMREAQEIAQSALQAAQEGLERDITQVGYSYTEARELIAGLNGAGMSAAPARIGAPAAPSANAIPAVVTELASAFGLVSGLLSEANALPSPLRGEIMDAFLGRARHTLESHIADVRARLQREVVDAALDRLRLEFVQRGSRAASGSTVEQTCLDAATADLRDALPTLRRAFEQAAALVMTRLLADAPYWQETRTDRLFREPATALPPHTAKRLLMSKVADTLNLTEADAAGMPALRPPRLLTPLPQSHILPEPSTERRNGKGRPRRYSRHTHHPDERARLGLFTRRMRAELPELLDNDLRLTALTFAHDIVTDRPPHVSYADMQEYLRTRQDAFNRIQAERWRKVAAIVERQMGDWLRTAAFALRLVQGVGARQKDIDAAIGALSAGWRMDRQVAVDRNILRLGAYELLYVEGVPDAAAINEAVELAKKYSTTESGRFVNGVLGALSTQAAREREDNQGANPPDGANNQSAALPEDDAGDDSLDLPDDMDEADLDTPVLEPANAPEEE